MLGKWAGTRQRRSFGLIDAGCFFPWIGEHSILNGREPNMPESKAAPSAGAHPVDAGNAASAEMPEAIAMAIQGILEDFDVQPVLFVGAGIARRYIGAPDWEGALKFALAQLGDSAQPYSYFLQKFGDNKVEIGTAIADLMFEWAWDENKGKSKFDPGLFEGTDRHIIIKSVIASHLQSLMPKSFLITHYHQPFLVDTQREQMAVFRRVDRWRVTRFSFRKA